MRVSRSGYYKWTKTSKKPSSKNEMDIVKCVSEVHAKHKTHGYRWVAAYMRINMGITISDNYAYKCFRYLGIRSETQHKRHYKPRKVKDKYPNLMYSTWETVDRPKQVIVSDMTAFKFGYIYYETTFYFDVFTKEVLASRVADRRGCRDQYIDGLMDVVSLLKGHEEPTILHTDQGSVFASMAYNDLIKDTNIVRSMSRAGKPTDNPVNESLNGWIKEEIMAEYMLNAKQFIGIDAFRDIIKNYVKYYNECRPCYAIGYDTPSNYRKRYYNGELEVKDSFSSRNPTPVPKFVQRKRSTAVNQDVV